MAGAPRDWQVECLKIKQRGAYLLQSGLWSDCSFLVGSEPTQVVVAGHKLFLAMASPVFEAMFYGGMADEGNEPIPILDVQPEAFKALLEYIYTDNINISSFDKACELCYGAKKYMLPHLVKECTRYLWSDLYPRNACRAYEFARLFDESVLMDKCIQIISTNTKEVLNDSSFQDVELNTVITVFSLDHLNIDSELDLFDAAVRYSKAQDKRGAEWNFSSAGDAGPTSDKRSKSPEPSTSKVVHIESSAENSPAAVPEPRKPDDIPEDPPAEPAPTDSKSKLVAEANKPTIRSAIEKIRFLTLTPQQFAEGPARSSLLTESEAFAVLMNILSSNSDVPMPNGFSTCRVPRKQLIGGGPSSGVRDMATFTVDTPSPVLEQVFGAHPLPAAAPLPPRASPPHAPRASPPVMVRHDAFPGSRIDRSSLMANSIAGVDPLLDRHGDYNKIYCQRAIIQHTDCLNTSVLDCSVTFMVDKNICLLGVQVPTQAPSEESAMCSLGSSGALAGGYSELLYAHLLDADGARLTYTHYTCRVPYRHLLDIMFNRPVYIQRNKVYKVGIVFNKVGWYPMGTCAQQVAAESVYFNFCIGQSSDSVRDGLIRSIIFTY